MKLNLKKYIGIAAVVVVMLTAANTAQAAGGFQIVKDFFKKVGSSIVFTNSSWHLGSSSQRIAKIWVTDLDCSGTCPSGGGGGTPGGSNTQVQFNDSSSFGGDAGLTYNKTTDALTVVGALSAATLDTGQGANELYDMDQNVLTTSDVVFNSATLGNTGLHVFDTDATHDLIIKPGSNLTADHTLTVTTGDADRTLTLSGNLTVSSAATVSGTNTGDVTLAGENYLSLSSQQITANAIALGGSNVTGTLTVDKGGTGQTSYTNGQLLIGNTTGNTLTKATLTGTSNQVTVTNGGGSITLSTPQDIATTSSPSFANVNLSAAAANARNVNFKTAGTSRWELSANATTESGSNAGSDFAINRFNDAGTYQDSPIVITRSTGVLALSSALPVSSGGTGQTSYTNGQILIGNTTGNTLTKATITGTSNQVNVTNGTGSITLSTPQDIATSSSPQFAKIGVGAAADASRLFLVTGDVSGGVATINRSNSATNAALGTVIIKGTSTGDMTDGFGPAFQFAIQDTAAVENNIAAIRGLRDGSDTSGKVDFSIARSGVSTVVATFRTDGELELTPPVTTSGSPNAITLTGAAHTTLAADTEASDVIFNLNRTVQFSSGGGTFSSQSAVKILAPTYAFSSADTISDAATLYIDDDIDAGTNATITRSFALWVDNGLSRFDGGVVAGNSNYYKMYNSSGTAISLMGVNGVDDVHYLADITSGVNAVWVGYNSPLAFTFGGSCCGGNLPTRFDFNSQNGSDFKTDDTTRLGLDDNSVNAYTHFVSNGSAPSASSCGTTPSVDTNATDNAGKVTIGTGTVTSCTLTFAASWTNAPACTITGNDSGYDYAATTTTSTLVITSSASMASDVVMYICIGTE